MDLIFLEYKAAWPNVSNKCWIPSEVLEEHSTYEYPFENTVKISPSSLFTRSSFGISGSSLKSWETFFKDFIHI